MELDALSEVLVNLGCPPEKSREMAAQLDKRARQLSAQRGDSYEHSMRHLLQLMQQGWAAQGRGGPEASSPESGTRGCSDRRA